MRNFFTIFMFFLLFHSQAQVIVGNGSGTATLYGPIYIFSATSTNTNSWNISIYSAAEILAAGLTPGSAINSISWFKTNANTYSSNDATFEVYLKETSSIDVVGSTAAIWANEVGALQPNFSSTGFGLPAVMGWVDVTLATPFTFTGTNNLMVMCRFSRPNNASGEIRWRSTNKLPAQVWHSFAPSTTVGTSYTSGNLPDIMLNGAGSVGVNNVEGFDFKVFPNPANDFLTIDLPQSNLICDYKIFNLLGSVVKEGRINSSGEQLQVGNLKNGFYFLQLIQGGKSNTVKFLKH